MPTHRPPPWFSIGRRPLMGLGLAWAGAVGAASDPGAPGPRLAAASDLQFALEGLADRFAARGGARPRISYGASGALQQQIRQGAPFELFFSADEALALALAQQGLAVDEGHVYGLGRLVFWHRAGSPLSGLPLREALASPHLKRLAIANPEFAPYGRAAQEALQSQGLWGAVQPRLVRAENVAQAAQFVATGNADAGLVAQALVRAPRYAALGQGVAVPAAWHAPLRQRVVRLRGAGSAAMAFEALVLSPEGQAALAEHGLGG